MELPQFINQLPEVDLPIPSTILRANILPSQHGQMVFFQAISDLELPPHSHGAQWGTVIDGRVEMTIGGVTKSYASGDSYFIPAGVVHSATAFAGAKVIDVFEENDRYRVKAPTDR